MATLNQIANLFDDPALRRRMRGAMVVLAHQIKTEDPATPNHERRLQAAMRLLNSAEYALAQIMPALLSHAAITDKAANPMSITDGEILLAVDNALTDIL